MLRTKLVLAGLVFCGLLVAGQSTALTAVFVDNFEDGNIAGWTEYSGTWSAVDDGTGSNKVLKSADNNGQIYIANRTWGDFDFSVDLKGGPRWQGLSLKAQTGWDSGYAVKLANWSVNWTTRRFLPKLYFYKAGTAVANANFGRWVSFDEWLRVRVVATGNMFEIYLQDSNAEDKLITYTDGDNTYSSGKLGLFVGGSASEDQFDNVSVIPEPVTLLLLGSGLLLGLPLFRRRGH